MKRSEINAYASKFVEFCKKYSYNLPEYNLDDENVVGELEARQIGFDITDFGQEDFEKTGLFLFTLRNGNPKEKNTIPYCEKAMFSLPGQVTPCHYHKQKTEDIFVRAGSDLIIRIWPKGAKKEDETKKLKVLFNGCEYREIESGKEISLKPGETVTLTPYLAHDFWGDPKGGGVLVGEVSTFNDDSGDNYFLDTVARFPKIDEDEEKEYLLVSDY